MGAGEFLLTSIDKDGTGEGFDLELIKQLLKYQAFLVSGGFGDLSHLDELIKFKKVTGLAIGRALHTNKFNINDIKQYLIRKNITIRI